MAAAATELGDLAEVLERVFADADNAVELDRRLWAQLAELGLTRLTGSESCGGSGAGWAEAAVLLTAVGRAAAAVPLAENDLLAGWLLERAGLETAGVRAAAPETIRTAAVLGPDGIARHVPCARAADSIVLLYESGDAWRVAEVRSGDFESAAQDNLAGEPRDTIRVAGPLRGAEVEAQTCEEFLRRGALARALMMTGAMERTLDLVVSHTTARTQFGRTLAKFQAVQHMVADIAAETALARAAAEAAVAVAEKYGIGSPEAGFAVAAAKSCGGHAASTVARNAHQCLGAIGTTREHDLHRYTTRLLAWRSEFGSVHHWDGVLTSAAAAAGRSGLWPLVVDGS